MYCSQLSIYGSRAYPMALSSLYEAMAEKFILPDIQTLMGSLKRDVSWPPNDRLQVYYMENMLEQNEKALFQVRFASAREARELVSIFLSVEQSAVQNITVVFPGRTGRGAFSQILAHVKSVTHALRMRDTFEFEAQGFPEQGPSGIFREHNLSAFVWVEGLGRYIHVKERPDQFSEVRRGKNIL